MHRLSSSTASKFYAELELYDKLVFKSLGGIDT